MAHYVFISYASEDEEVANKVCQALERGGVECWIAPRDVPYGADYEEAIVDAIASSSALVLIFSSNSNASPHVKREIQSAYADDSTTKIVPLRIEDIEYNKALRYYLRSARWLDASAPPLEQHLGRLVEHVRAHLSRADDAARPEPSERVASGREVPVATAALDTQDAPHTSDVLRASAESGAGHKASPAEWLAVGAAALLLVILVGVFASRARRDSQTNITPPGNINVNANNATPTPQRTPTPTPTPTPAQTESYLLPATTPTPAASMRPRATPTPEAAKVHPTPGRYNSQRSSSLPKESDDNRSYTRPEETPTPSPKHTPLPAPERKPVDMPEESDKPPKFGAR